MAGCQRFLSVNDAAVRMNAETSFAACRLHEAVTDAAVVARIPIKGFNLTIKKKKDDYDEDDNHPLDPSDRNRTGKKTNNKKNN